MEQDTAKQCLSIGRLLNGSAAYQDSRTCVQTDLLMSAIGLEGTHILDKDQLAPACQHGGDHDRDHADTVHIDTGCIGNRTVLANGTELLTEALSSYPDFTAWAFGTLPGADELAARVRMEPVRQLLRMERPLAPAGQAPAEAEGYEIVTYDPADREAIVALNAAAFSHHPEQGRLTVAEFEDLTRQDWFDPAGLFVARRDGEVAGFHWTKQHGDGLGEVYVIAVAPEHEGRGLGRVLLQRGLDHLAGSGDERVQLYVEADQERVVRMYDRAGFTVGQVDTSYRRKG